MTSLIIYTDGGARGNPGPAGVGVVIKQGPGSRVHGSVKEIKKYIGETTNNVAEYTAVMLGLEEAFRHGAKEVELRLDSELVGKQLKGEYKVKDKDLQSLFVKVWNLKVKFRKLRVTIISREKNREADRLVNEVLDNQANKE